MSRWSEWSPFPDPGNNENICAPIGPGVYELRHKGSKELILFGSSKNVAYRMTSLLPKPLGRGTRKNESKRDYVLKNLSALEYRTLACVTEVEAKQVERELRVDKIDYKFKT